MAIKRYAGDVFVGLSSDTKPTNVPDGARFYETDTLEEFLLVSGTWVSTSAVGPQGPQGDQGAQGAQGNQGNQGNQGTAGAQGNQGDQGAAGAQGNQGNQGNQGAAGAQGTQGNQGDQGAQGAQGNQGNQGDQGAAGAQGNQGDQGAAGAQGNQGNQGNQGAAGAQGAQGAQGNQGNQGDQGADGAGLTWQSIGSGFEDPIAVNYGYVVTAELVLDLPATAALGDQILIVGQGGQWSVAPASGDLLYFLDGVTVSGANGYVQAGTTYDTVQFVCVEANAKWRGILYSGSPSLRVGGVYGYTSGGNSGANVVTTEKITFSTNATAAATTANLAAVKQAAKGAGTLLGYGFVIGGVNGGVKANAEKITYSTDTIAAATTANFSGVRYNVSKVCFQTTRTYFGGGWNGSSVVGTLDRLIHATSTTGSIGALLTTKMAAGGVSGQTRGYFCGGATNASTGFIAAAERITYSTDALIAMTTANLVEARLCDDGLSDVVIKGFLQGGYQGGNSTKSERITFSTETASNVTTATLSTARRSGGQVSEGLVKGYYLGGYSSGNTALADLLVYSSETSTAQTTANLTVARYNSAGQSDAGL